VLACNVRKPILSHSQRLTHPKGRMQRLDFGAARAGSVFCFDYFNIKVTN
jgi:hypothetical protein